MKKILVTYETMSGSTAEVAQAVGEEIAGEGAFGSGWNRRSLDLGVQICPVRATSLIGLSEVA